MPSHRLQQINKLIQSEINIIITRELRLEEGTLTTITDVKTSPDLSQSKISISIIPPDKQGSILHSLNKRAKHLQCELGKKIILRKTPRIFFVIDESQEKAAHINDLIDKIHQER